MRNTTGSEPAPSSARPRVAYLDWLRVLAVLLLIPFHSARLFDAFESFYVKNAETDMLLSAFIGFLTSWHMPLLFILAGAATCLALGFRSPTRYVGERFQRLLIPLIFATAVVVPPQMYFAQRFHSQYGGSYLDFYPGFFQMVSGSDYPGIGFSFAHLWFILFLFVISLVALPLFLAVRAPASAAVMARLASSLARPRAILLLALPLPFTTFLEDPMGHNFGLYLIVFVYGYLLLSDPRYALALRDSRWLATGLASVCTLAYLALAAFWDTTGEGYSVPSALFVFTFFPCAWFWSVAALGFGQKYLNVGNAALRYASEAAYPVYILHQTVIVILGFFVVQWPLPALLKFVLLTALSLAGTLAIYDLLIRRIGVLRFLFGMKPLGQRVSRGTPPVTKEA